MKTKRLMVLAAMATACAGFVGYQQTWKGMIAAEPAAKFFSMDQKVLNLKDFKNATLVCQNFDPAYSIPTSELEALANNKLRGIGVRTMSPVERAGTPSFRSGDTDEAILKHEDAQWSMLRITIRPLKVGQSVALSIEVDCMRGAFLHPGYFSSVIVWDQTAVVSYSDSGDRDALVRESVGKLLDKFSVDYRKCN